MNFRISKSEQVCSVISCGLFPLSVDASQVFTDFFEVRFKKIVRMVVAKEAFIKLEIYGKTSADGWRQSCYIGDKIWERTVKSYWQKKRKNVAPCKSHQVRIWVHGKYQRQSSFQFPLTIPNVGQNALASSGYRPH